jgi:steroid delta-isomerase-like uncharacterized protein
MTREHAYLGLAIGGAAAPWLGFARFFSTHGWSGDFVGALFSSGASAGFTIDLLISSLVFWIFLFERSGAGRLDHPWIFVALNLVIGLSCALPLALWRMERLKRAESQAGSTVRHSAAALLLALSILLLAAMPVAADPSTGDPSQVVDLFFDAYRSRNVDGMVNLYSPDAVFTDVGQRHRFEGRDQLRTFLRGLVALHHSMDVEIKRQLVSGDQVVVEYLYTGTLSGEALHQRTGNESCSDTQYAIPVTSWFDVRDGKIVRQTDFIDLATLAEVRARASGAKR